MHKSLTDYLAKARQQVDAALEHYLPGEEEMPSRLHRAMRYSVFAGGKRFRPILVLMGAEVCGGTDTIAMPVACAFELVHTYSLIHDDLPAMDNDDMRRGRPTSHKAFDEATAILAGDALLTRAFELIAEHVADADVCSGIIRELGRAAGSRGMVGGQAVDMDSQNASLDPGVLEYLHTHKTGALITAAVVCGGIVARADSNARAVLLAYGKHVGLAFQIADDILDVEATPEQLGKTPGKDAKEKKLTYPLVYGIEKSKLAARENRDAAKRVLKFFGPNARMLSDLADFVVERGS